MSHDARLSALADALTEQIVRWSRDRIHRLYHPSSEERLRAWECEDRSAAEAARVLASVRSILDGEAAPTVVIPSEVKP